MARAWLTSNVLLVICLAAMGGHAGTGGSSEVSCPRVAESPTLDGNLDDWPALPQLVLSEAEDWHPTAAQFAEYKGPDDASGEVRLAWDNQALYIAIQVRDETLVRVRSASEIDRGDSIVLSVVGEGSQEFHQFVLALLKAASLVWRAEPAGRAGEVRAVNLGISVATEENGGVRVTYEMALPWSQLSPVRPLPGAELTLTVSVCDDDGEGLEGCLERSVGVMLSAAGITPIPRVSPAAALEPEFAAPEVARFGRKCFALKGQEVVLFGGEMDYAGLPSAAWPERLAALKAAGMNTVGVTAVWSRHQPTAGGGDLGALRDFLSLCREHDLWVLLSVGPYAGEDREAGGVPGWVVNSRSEEKERQAVEGWYGAVLAAAKEHQLTAGGPVAALLVRPLPGERGEVQEEAAERLMSLVRQAGIEVPVLTANTRAARNNTKPLLANLLDTVSFYRPPQASDLVSQLRSLCSEENGPPVISGMVGDYQSPEGARRAGSALRVAIAMAASGLMVSGFAPGLEPTRVLSPGEVVAEGIVNQAGARGDGYGEMRLFGSFLTTFGRRLARAVSVEGLVNADDPGVQVAARISADSGFVFLWDERGEETHHVRLTYLDPETERTASIPEAGAIVLPPGGARVVVTDLPLGRGKLLYCTSEIVGLHQMGDRVLLVVCGEADTPGEIALRRPGQPLVAGEVVRQRWEEESKTLVLDYYHGESDRYLLVDEVEIAILSRRRAAFAAQALGYEGAATISAGAHVASASLDPAGLEALVECGAGAAEVTVALPRQPASVTVDGEPVEFTFDTPERVARFRIATESFEEEGRPSSVLGRLSRAVLGGPPQLSAEFDRGWFMPDDLTADGWRAAGSLGRAPEELGLDVGGFARLRARFDPAGSTTLRITGSTDPALVFVNGRLVPDLCGSEATREAELDGMLKEGENRIEMVVHLLPRAAGAAGLRRDNKRLPVVALVGESGESLVGNWEVARGLAGEAAGWAGAELDTSRWHYLRFGPWREQGGSLRDLWGVGWYRVAFGLPGPGKWRIPYQAKVRLKGTAAVYINGSRVATCGGDGTYLLPIPSPPLEQGGSNVLAAAVYGLAPNTGVERVEIAADREQMTKRRAVEIRF